MTPEQIVKLEEWRKALDEAVKAKSVIAAEQALRKEVAALFFPTPEEGTNNQELAGGWKLKYVHKIDRSIDIGALPAIRDKLRELDINPDPLVDMKPSLNMKAYRSLEAINSYACRIFEEALTIKPGSPTLELIPPKDQQ